MTINPDQRAELLVGLLFLVREVGAWILNKWQHRIASSIDTIAQLQRDSMKLTKREEDLARVERKLDALLALYPELQEPVKEPPHER